MRYFSPKWIFRDQILGGHNSKPTIWSLIDFGHTQTLSVRMHRVAVYIFVGLCLHTHFIFLLREAAVWTDFQSIGYRLCSMSSAYVDNG